MARPHTNSQPLHRHGLLDMSCSDVSRLEGMAMTCDEAGGHGGGM